MLFVPESQMDAWVAEEKVSLEGERLQVPGAAAAYHLIPAVSFLRDVAGDGDVEELVGRARSVAALEEAGGEIYQGSVLLGESAYDVVPGFFIEVPAALRGQGVPAAAEPGAAPAPSHEELLAAFLLDHMR